MSTGKHLFILLVLLSIYQTFFDHLISFYDAVKGLLSL